MPLIYVPLEAVASKWYGESERNLAEIFKAAEQLGGAIIFLDEIDSLATQRRCPALLSVQCMLPCVSLPLCMCRFFQRPSCQQQNYRYRKCKGRCSNRPFCFMQALAA